MKKLYKIFIADDHELIINSVQWLIEGTEDLTVIGSANSGRSTILHCLHLQPDLLLLDLMMPGFSSIEVIEQLRREVPQTKILVMSAFRDPIYIKTLQALDIHGYILKEEAPDLLLTAIRTVVRNAMWFSRTIFQTMIDPLPPSKAHEAWKTLTHIEQEILLGIGQGLNNRQIAHNLCLAEQTVRNYCSHLYEHLGIHSRAEVVVWLRTHRILSPEGTPLFQKL